MTVVMGIITGAIAAGLIGKTVRLLKFDHSAYLALQLASSARQLLFPAAITGLIVSGVIQFTDVLKAFLTPLLLNGLVSASLSLITLFTVAFLLELVVALRNEKFLDAEEETRIRSTVERMKAERSPGTAVADD